MSALKKVFWIALVVKLVLTATLPLTSDEAYYWVWSRHLQLSYYDHPPFVAWLFWLGDATRFFPGSVRWPGVVLGHATLGIWLRLLEPYLDSRQRLYWLGLALLSPLVGGSSLIVTPDLPLLFFYGLSLALFFVWRRSPNIPMSFAFGVALGLGFSSKYVMVLFGLSLVVVGIYSREVRRALLRRSPWLALGLIAATTPVWLWNYANHFASLKFQAAHGLGQTRWNPEWTLEYLASQVGLLFPPVLYWALRRSPRLPREFAVFAWTPLVFFLLATFRGRAEANWPIVAYPSAFALAAAWIPRNRIGLRSTLSLWAVALVAITACAFNQPNFTTKTKIQEFRQFEPLEKAIAGGFAPLYARSYQMAAKLHFETGRPVYKLAGMTRTDFYDYLPESTPAEKVYYVAVEKGDELPRVYTERGHKVAEAIPVNDQFEIWRVESP